MYSLPRPLTWVSVCLCAALLGCSAGDGSLPVELQGRWTTADARYEGRYFEVTPEQELIFGQGAGSTHGGIVESVEVAPDTSGKTSCEITYSDPEGVEFDITLRLSADRTSFVFENSRKVRWVREEGPR